MALQRAQQGGTDRAESQHPSTRNIVNRPYSQNTSSMQRLPVICTLFLAALLGTLGLSCGPKTEDQTIRFGVIADVHKDVMHDADERLAAFIDDASSRDLDFIIQLGDFVRPYDYNLEFLGIWNAYQGDAWHVLGNHDTDGGFSFYDVVEYQDMPGRYYSFDRKGVRFIVLDGNEVHPEGRRPGYQRYMGAEQIEWMLGEVRSAPGRVVLFSHQTLKDKDMGVENADEIRAALEAENRAAGYTKVIAAIAGHNHTDYTEQINGIHYLAINSASYSYVGSQYATIRFSEEVDRTHPYIKYTIPYQNSIYAFVTIEDDAIRVHGKRSRFEGPGPVELGMPPRPANNPIVPYISDRYLPLD